MKIAILSCFYPFRGGISQFNAGIFTELSKVADVKAFNFKRQYPSFLFPGKTQYVTAEDEAVAIESESLLDTANPFTWNRTAKAIREWDPDILVMRYWMSYFAPSLGYVARRMKKKCKVIAILDNVIPHERHFFDRPLTSYFLSGVDGCITMCAEVAKDLTDIKPSAKYIVRPHPLYTHFGAPLKREDAEKKLHLQSGKKNLLFFGLIREYKGLDILLEAFRLLPDDYQLIIAGEPYGSFDRYSRILESLPGKDRVHIFPEYIRDSQVKDYFSAADLTVLPYRSATQSGISSISYHFEVPMVVTDVGGLRETVGLRGTGLIANKPDSVEIKDKVEEYFSTPKTAERCRECIRKEKERLSWSGFCNSLINFAGELK